MSKKRFSLEFDGMEKLVKKLESLNGNLKSTAERALQESQKHVTPKIKKAMRKDNLPAKGKYSSGDTEKSIIENDTVNWNGTVASIDIGFDMDKSGLKSVYLIHGTPKMNPVKGLKASIYGSASKKEVEAIQNEVFQEEIKRMMEGK